MLRRAGTSRDSRAIARAIQHTAAGGASVSRRPGGRSGARARRSDAYASPVGDAFFDELDFLYMPSRDVARDLAFYTEVLGAQVVFAIEAFDTRVAQVRLIDAGPRL